LRHLDQQQRTGDTALEDLRAAMRDTHGAGHVA
jgi:hypothetical protein